MAALPSGPVTFLFTDIEGSTARWEHQPEAMRVAGLGELARAATQYERSIALHEEGESVFRTLDDDFGLWRALYYCSETLAQLGDDDRARPRLEESLRIARAMSHPWGVAQGLRHLGVIAYHQDDLDRAGDLLDESLVWWAKLGATRGLHNSLLELGNVALARNKDQRAASYYGESLTLVHQAGDRSGVARCFEGLAATSARSDTADASRPHTTRAARLLGTAAALREATGIPVSPHERSNVERAEAAARARLGEDRFASEWATGRAMGLEQAVADALGEPRSA